MIVQIPRRRLGPFAIVSLSLLVPLCIIAASVGVALIGKPFGYSSKEQDTAIGTVKNGELWHCSTTNGTSLGANIHEYHLQRTDLKTGKKTDTGVFIRSQFLHGVWLDNDYYVCTELATYKLVGGKLEQVGTGAPNWTSTFPDAPFAYEGRLTKVMVLDGGDSRLSQFIDGHWSIGRRVLLPGVGRDWYQDSHSGRARLLPLTSEQPVGRRTGQATLTVIQHAGQTHLFVYEQSRFSAYRNGFEFVDEEDSIASALAPANSAHEVSGWESIFNPERTFRFGDDQMACDADGPIFSYSGDSDPQCRLMRRCENGSLEVVAIPRNYAYSMHTHFCADPMRKGAYLVSCDPYNWNGKRIIYIEGNALQIGDVWLPGDEAGYRLRCYLVLVGVLMAWLAHIAILTGGADRETGKTAPRNYQFGHQRVTLASTWQRARALIVDAALVVIIFLPFQFLGLEYDRYNGPLSWRMLELEQSLAGVSFPFQPPGVMASILELVKSFRMHFVDPLSFYLVLAWIGLAISLSIIWQGRYGVTPGKWLVGISTVGATLRPCGMFRSLVRTLLLCVDLASFLTPLPAAISIMRSDHRQRLGDQVTDTIVIERQ